jgi:surface protein
MKFNNETIREAVKEWLDDDKLAELKYGHISNWDTSDITDMRKMFFEAESFNQSLGNWDVSNVTNMEGMFRKASSFNQPIGEWDVSNVTNMDQMFYQAYSFNRPIGEWDVSNVTNTANMFYSLFHNSLKLLITKLKVCNITPFPLSFYTSRATFRATLKTKKPVNHFL